MESKDFIVDDNIYGRFKGKNGQEITLKDVQDNVFKIVLEIDRVCRKNNIPYALAFGSTLGVYNYHDFVPWDDDIDIAIDYFDIPRLIEAFKKDLSDEFSFDCYEVDKRYNTLINTMKVRLKNSRVREVNWPTLPNRCKNGNGLFVDIVAFMGVPDNNKEHMCLIKYSKRRMVPYVILDAFLRIHPYHMKKKLKALEKETAEKYRDSSIVSQTVIIPFQDWGNDKENISFPKEVIYPFKEYDFRGVKLYSFNDAKEFCRLCYGEKSLKQFDGEKWFDPYPKKKRHARHIRKVSL